MHWGKKSTVKDGERWQLHNGAVFDSDIELEDVQVDKIKGMSFEWNTEADNPAPVSVTRVHLIPTYLPESERKKNTVRFCYDKEQQSRNKVVKMRSC